MKKSVEIDFESLDDLGHWINVLKSHFSSLKKKNDPNFITRNERIKMQFEACVSILDTDISSLYKDMPNLDSAPIYYVYAHCDPGFKIALKKNGKTTFAATLGMRNVPFYIGKGTGNRAFDLNRNESHRKVRQKIQKFDQEVDVAILRTGMTELEALCMEAKLIDIFGLISQRNGHLVNLDEGISSEKRHSFYRDKLNELSSLFRNSV